MKKVKLLLLLLAFLPGLKAAEAGDLYFGGQGLYTTVDKYFGFGARAEYNFWRALEASTTFNFSPKKTIELQRSTDRKEFSLDGNLHYLLRLGEYTALYPLAGVNYTRRDILYHIGGTPIDTKEDNVGVNLGFGLRFDVNSIRFGGEWKYILTGNDDFERHQLMLHVGYFFNPRW